jgi:SSS family solute:Na+ symporter
MPEFAAIDYAVIALYILGIIACGLWVGRGERGTEDYFLAGRNLPWYLIGFSLFASNMSGASFVGLMGASYSHGMVVYNYEWTATLVLIVFALFMLPVFLRARLVTVTEYLELRFDRRARWAYALFTILTIMFIDTAGALFAGSVVIGILFPGSSLWLTSILLALAAGGYTIFGGLRAVVVTDAVQAVLMIFGAALILYFGLEQVGGWDALMTRLDAAEKQLIKPVDDAFLPWPGIFGVILLGFYYWSLNQYFVQRALGARSLEDGRKGALFGGLLKLPNVFLMVIPGMIAIVLFPDLEQPDQVFPLLAFEVLPIGLRGLILAALLAAIMSSLDSALNAASSLLTMDFIRPLRPQMSDRALLTTGRIATAVLMAAAACYAPLIERFGSLFSYFQSTLAYLVPPIVAVYLAGLFSRRATATGAFWAIASAFLLGLPLFLVKEATGLWSRIGLPEVHFTYMSIALFAVALAILALAGRAEAVGKGSAAEAMVFRRSDLQPGTAGVGRLLADARLHAAGLAVLLAAAVTVFW